MTMATSTQSHQPVLVLGGTGKTGRRVARLLTDRGHRVRIGSRSASPPFDWEDAATWSAALDGVGAVYVCYQPDLAFPGAPDVIAALAARAVEHGVRTLVLLAGRGEPAAEAAEERIRQSGAQWTIVRASFFHQNFSEDFFLPSVLAGEIALPVGDAPEPFVDADDIAEVVAAALTDDRHVGQTYELTGPRLLTFSEVAAELSAATGREVRFVPVTKDEYVAELRAQGVPEEFAELFDLVTDGRNAHLGDGVQRALGRPPRDFADYAAASAAAGVWSGTSTEQAPSQACEGLGDVRHEIDRVDDQIVQQLAAREALVRRAASYKSDEQAVRAADRAAQVLDRVRSVAAEKGASPDVVEQVYRVMIDAFIALELDEHRTA